VAYTDTVTPVQKYNIFTPFFQSTRASGESRTTNYDCLFCNVSVPSGAIAARSFTGTAIVWTHIECLRQVPGATLSTDGAAKFKAMKAYETRRDAAREAARAEKRTAAISLPTPAGLGADVQTSTPAPTIDEAQLRATIEAEYLTKLAAIRPILEMQRQRIQELEQELAAAKAAAIYAPYDEQTRNARQNDSALTPAEQAQDKPGVTRCGLPKKDGTPCQWNTAKSPCRHHGTSAVVKAMSNPQNETTLDVVTEEARTPAPAPQEKPFGTERPTSGTHYAILDGCNKYKTIFRLSGDLFQNGQTGGGYSYFASDEIQPKLLDMLTAHGNSTPILATVRDKTITGAVVPNDTAKAARKAQAKAQRTSAS